VVRWQLRNSLITLFLGRASRLGANREANSKVAAPFWAVDQ
jgi:hypothetical protein